MKRGYSYLEADCVGFDRDVKRMRMPRTLGKRDGEELVNDGKRSRVCENGALQRMLEDAYIEINALREELKQAKMEVEFYQRRMNLPYNHDIECY